MTQNILSRLPTISFSRAVVRRIAYTDPPNSCGREVAYSVRRCWKGNGKRKHWTFQSSQQWLKYRKLGRVVIFLFTS